MPSATSNRNNIPNANTQIFKEINGKARVQLYGFVLCDKHTCLVYNIYGYTGGETNKEAANRTNDIIKVIPEDAKQQLRGPVLIDGDLNSSASNKSNLEIKLKRMNSHRCKSPGRNV